MQAPPQLPGEEAIRATVNEILSRPEFRASSDLPWYVEVWRKFREWAEQFNGWMADHPVEGWLVIGLLVIVLLALLAHLAYLALADVWPWQRARASRGPSASSWTILEGAARNWQEALAKARRASAEGNQRLAVWISHRVLLGLLDEQGAIRFAAGKTNTDYLRECASDHPGRQTLAALTEVYDRVVYGQQPGVPAKIDELLGRVDGHRASAPPTPGGSPR
jgi:hypothetical protein